MNARQRTFHAQVQPPPLAPRSKFIQGPFGRLFRELPAWAPAGNTEQDQLSTLHALAEQMFEPENPTPGTRLDNPRIPAGYTYFGQFLAHDITFDATSSLERQNDPERLHNFRTPRFDLDSLYGSGPQVHPFLYERSGRSLLLTGRGRKVTLIADSAIDMCNLDITEEDDLPRNQQGLALIGDPRNDENILISQLHLAFIKFHNAILEKQVVGEERLAGSVALHRAQQLVRWHYQWVVLHDYLPRLVGEDVIRELLPKDRQDLKRLREGLRWYCPHQQAFLPLEFTAAAFRMGHSMVRGSYTLNETVENVPIFRPPNPGLSPFGDLRGGRPLPEGWSVDWHRFFQIEDSVPQPSRRIDPRLHPQLRTVPVRDEAASLPFLNLLRGWRLDLPSGQAVARRMGASSVYSNADLGLDESIGREAPLWYYILKEAEIEARGEHLGSVGGRLVAETLVGLALEDPSCYLRTEPRWKPSLQTAGADFELADILRFAGVLTKDSAGDAS